MPIIIPASKPELIRMLREAILHGSDAAVTAFARDTLDMVVGLPETFDVPGRLGCALRAEPLWTGVCDLVRLAPAAVPEKKPVVASDEERRALLVSLETALVALEAVSHRAGAPRATPEQSEQRRKAAIAATRAHTRAAKAGAIRTGATATLEEVRALMSVGVEPEISDLGEAMDEQADEGRGTSGAGRRAVLADVSGTGAGDGMRALQAELDRAFSAGARKRIAAAQDTLFRVQAGVERMAAALVCNDEAPTKPRGRKPRKLLAQPRPPRVARDTRDKLTDPMDRYRSRKGDRGVAMLSRDFPGFSLEILRAIAARCINGVDRLALVNTRDDAEVVTVAVHAMQDMTRDGKSQELRWPDPDGRERTWHIRGHLAGATDEPLGTVRELPSAVGMGRYVGRLELGRDGGTQWTRIMGEDDEGRVGADEHRVRMARIERKERGRFVGEAGAVRLAEQFPGVSPCVVQAVCARFQTSAERARAIRSEDHRLVSEIMADALRRLPDDGQFYQVKWPHWEDDEYQENLVTGHRDGLMPEKKRGHPEHDYTSI